MAVAMGTTTIGLWHPGGYLAGFVQPRLVWLSSRRHTNAHAPVPWLRLLVSMWYVTCLALIKRGYTPCPKIGAPLPSTTTFPKMSNSSTLPPYVAVLLPLAIKEQPVINAERYISGEFLFIPFSSRVLRCFR